ncbi:hypothetical protein KR222_006636, partial [Zaprionus bogoriensis]
VIVLTLRITLITALAYDEPRYVKALQMAVIRVYISLAAVIILQTMLMCLSLNLIYATTEWLTVLYIPLLIYTIFHTYHAIVVYLSPLLDTTKTKEFLSQKWLRYIEKDDVHWIQIQMEMHCCGLEGPSSYLDYLRQVHPSCYVNRIEGGTLITQGCEQVIDENFGILQPLAAGVSWYVLIVQLL